MTTIIAVTGATGFIGGPLIDALRSKDWHLRLLARNPDRLRHAESSSVEIIKGDLSHRAALARLCENADLVIHGAGLTHAHKEADYFDVNVGGAARLAAAAQHAGAKLLHISSLSARMPGLSPYARSKRESEAAVCAQSGTALCLRLPAIYGPKDRAALPLFKAAKGGFALQPKGPKPHLATMLYVDDVADAIACCAYRMLADNLAGGTYEIADEALEGRSWPQIFSALSAASGKTLKPITPPQWLLGSYTHLVLGVERLLGRGPSVRAGQAAELYHPDWVARHNLLNDAIGWKPQMSLEKGIAKTYAWYLENGYL